MAPLLPLANGDIAPERTPVAGVTMKPNNVLPWRPKIREAVAVSDSKVLWSVQKEQWKIECTLEGTESQGWSIRVLLNGQWFFCCQFASMADAVHAANDKYAELLNAGWT
jgi:plasmid maintenance system killer protein